MIFLQPALLPLRHKSLSYALAVCPWICASGKAHSHGVKLRQHKRNNSETVIFCTRRSDRTAQRRNRRRALIMLPWPPRSGTGRKPADTAPNWNWGIFLFLSQPQIMRFIVYRSNENVKSSVNISPYFIITSRCLYSGYLSALRTHKCVERDILYIRQVTLTPQHL